MDIPLELIRVELEKVLRSIAEQEGKGFEARIRPILFTNLDRGRLESFIEGELQLVPEYVTRVAAGYKNMGHFVCEIQAERTSSAWDPLYRRMRMWAYNFFLRKGFGADAVTQNIAEESATEAALTILGAHFPYDTDFEPWAHVIVQNACRNYIRKAIKKSVVPEQNIVDLDETLIDAEHSSSVNINQEHREEERDLFEAIAQLSGVRRQVIELIYFNGLSPAEISKKMRKSVGAVYSLQFNALRDLRKILNANGNFTND